jgi:hypothetical protein
MEYLDRYYKWNKEEFKWITLKEGETQPFHMAYKVQWSETMNMMIVVEGDIVKKQTDKKIG